MIQSSMEGATPLNPEEEADLIPSHIVSQSELNDWEYANILEAEIWLNEKRPEPVLTIPFLRELHRRMFDKTWKWAGKFRTTGKNLGVPASEIPGDVYNLLEDTKYQIEHKSYTNDEMAARFHHRLVFIHPFPNGNGRHARLMTEALQVQLGSERFTWGNESLVREGEARTAYLAALKSADKGEFGDLIAFARS